MVLNIKKDYIMKKAGILMSMLFLLNFAAVPAYAETGSYENLLYTKIGFSPIKKTPVFFLPFFKIPEQDK